MNRNLFQVQREMRRRREAALKRGVVAILDVGSTKTACLILQFTDADTPPEDARSRSGITLPSMSAFRVVGVKVTRSRGIAFGEVVDLAEAEAALRTAIQGAQKMAELRVDHAIVCFSGGHPRSYGLAGQTEIEAGDVSERDIGRVLAACDVPDYGQDREAIHAMPVNFAVDHRSGLSDPRGHTGVQLAVDMHMLTVAGPQLDHLIEIVRRCDLELAGLAFSGFAAGISALVEDEQQLGAAVVDMGGGSTALSVFVKKHMIYADAVRLGGDHVTGDISRGLQVSMEVAERIKTVNGGLIATGADDRDMIELPNPMAQWENDRRMISRSELIGVMRPRIEEILEEVRARLDAAGFEHLPGQRIVLTGGAAQVPGMQAMAERVLGRQTRIGRPLRISGLPQAMTGPNYAAAVGLALHTSQPADECWDFEAPVDRLGTRRLRRAVRWLRENW